MYSRRAKTLCAIRAQSEGSCQHPVPQLQQHRIPLQHVQNRMFPQMRAIPTAQRTSEHPRHALDHVATRLQEHRVAMPMIPRARVHM